MKLILFFAVFFVNLDASAVDIFNVYRGSCQISSGVVIKVDESQIFLADVHGHLQTIPRYDIVGLTLYALPDIPIPLISNSTQSDVDIMSFDTYVNGEVVPLGEGWPIDFTKDYVQIINREGADQQIQRDRIWGINSTPVRGPITFKRFKEQHSSYLLRHPLAFERCGKVIVGGGNMAPLAINPQNQLTDIIGIKHFFDDKKSGYAKLYAYEERQQFYPIPQYNSNQTKIGSWAILGSRYANVGARQANFLPIVQDEFSEGPFGFQRVARSGLYPILWSLHDEPVVQVFYGINADYIHLEVFFDPLLVLIGKQYEWQKDQLNNIDDRLIENAGGEFGFNFGRFSIFAAATLGSYAFRSDDQFELGSFGAPKLGLKFQHLYHVLSAYVGRSTIVTDFGNAKTLNFFRVNNQIRLSEAHQLRFSVLGRKITDAGYSDKDKYFGYTGTAYAASGQWDWAINHRWTSNLLLSVENFAATVDLGSGRSNTTNANYPKLAGGATISF